MRTRRLVSTYLQNTWFEVDPLRAYFYL